MRCSVDPSRNDRHDCVRRRLNRTEYSNQSRRLRRGDVTWPRVRVLLTSCAGMTTHVENFLFQNCNIFSVSSIFKSNKIGEINNKFITSQSFLSGRVQKECDELLCTVWSLVMVRKPVASAKWLTSCAGMTCHASREFFVSKLQYFLSSKYI